MTMPKTIAQQMNELREMMDKDDERHITPQDAARLIGITPEALRDLIDCGKVPFAIGGRKGPHNNGVFKIPKIAFYIWMTQGHGVGMGYLSVGSSDRPTK